MRANSTIEGCQTCGKPIKVQPWQKARGFGKFCSYACTGASRGYSRLIDCPNCGREFRARGSEIDRGTGKYCSQACYFAFYWRDPERERFWLKVDKSGDCWEWTAAKDRQGYGFFGGERASREAWRIASGTDPGAHLVLHTCDNAACVRNDEPGVYLLEGRELPRWGHLFLGTVRDNSRDMVQKGRTIRGRKQPNPAHGERHHKAKLTEAKVLDVLSRLAGGETKAAIARRYGVTEASVYAIAKGLSWKHIPRH